MTNLRSNRFRFLMGSTLGSALLLAALATWAPAPAEAQTYKECLAEKEEDFKIECKMMWPSGSNKEIQRCVDYLASKQCGGS